MCDSSEQREDGWRETGRIGRKKKNKTRRVSPDRSAFMKLRNTYRDVSCFTGYACQRIFIGLLLLGNMYKINHVCLFFYSMTLKVDQTTGDTFARLYAPLPPTLCKHSKRSKKTKCPQNSRENFGFFWSFEKNSSCLFFIRVLCVFVGTLSH